MIWYRVQIGAYALKKSAEKISVNLIEKGFKTSITKEKLLYKVRVGSFQDKAKAEKLLKRVHQYKQYEKAKILEWNDGKDLPIIDISPSKPAVEDYKPVIKFVAIWHTETCEYKYGDAQVFIEYAKNGIDILHAVLVEIIFKRRLRGFHMPFDDRVVATFGDDMLPGILQSFPGFVVLGENQNAGSVFVQTVDDEDSGFRIFLGDIVRD